MRSAMHAIAVGTLREADANHDAPHLIKRQERRLGRMLDVLLIEDEVGLREPLEEMLRDAGHNVQVAIDGAAGWSPEETRSCGSPAGG